MNGEKCLLRLEVGESKSINIQVDSSTTVKEGLSLALQAIISTALKQGFANGEETTFAELLNKLQ